MKMVLVLIAVIAIGVLVIAATRREHPDPGVAIFNVTAEQVWDGKDELRGEWVNVTGKVKKTDDGEVKLYADDWWLFGSFAQEVSLHDLPIDQQAQARQGALFSSTCKVGGDGFWSLNLRHCRR